jgi:hypothetical protein
MNITQRLTPLTLIAATLAACFLVQSARAETPVVRLEPVHITAKRVPANPITVVRLPRVEVTASRAQPQAVHVVHLPVVEVSARLATEATGLLAQRRLGATPKRNVAPA